MGVAKEYGGVGLILVEPVLVAPDPTVIDVPLLLSDWYDIFFTIQKIKPLSGFGAPVKSTPFSRVYINANVL